eukprot:TRINITY_DN3107_c0_g1_i2.p1 TRINITY_DN3107_c0_g1~~TRINITY_DN3107_c0_g1_i2.p1  ORF type:complete len:249 (+),score=50.36 TRINITY_DN3107_c0_g1_i2:330-1076(+)
MELHNRITRDRSGVIWVMSGHLLLYSRDRYLFQKPAFQAPANTASSSLAGTMLCALDDELFAFAFLGNVTMIYSHSADPADTSAWRERGQLCVSRCAAAVVTLHGAIYIHGGLQSDTMTQRGDLERFDPRTDQCELLALGTPAAGHACCVQDGKIYHSGGFRLQSFLRVFECYDPKLNMWTSLEPMHYDVARHSMVSGGGSLIYVFGGNGEGHSPAGRMYEVYDVKTGRWRESAQFPVLFTAMAAIGR